jgi:EAL and modified HD-GYP domain-containing signal transduction protein
MQDFLIGRQQIIDRKQKLFAYELLFRDANGNGPKQVDAGDASRQVIVNSLLEEGLERVVGTHRAFINFTRDNLLSGLALVLPKEKVVIEVLESVTVDDAVVQAVTELRRQGYMIALDDFVFSNAWLPLVKLAHIVKLDIHQTSIDTNRRYMAALGRLPIQFLAEKVETSQQFSDYLEMGCHYFQGFLFSRPIIVQGRRAGTGQHAVVRLLAEINRADIEIAELADIISLDAGLCYRLLRYINNSGFFRLPQKVDSIQRAIYFLGLKEIRRWANLVALASFPDTPVEVINISLARAKMCELLALAAGRVKGEEFFLTGLMSMLEQLMNQPMAEILAQLPLADETVRALLRQEGVLGEALLCAIQYECWNLEEARFADLDMKAIGQIFVDSVAWANEVSNSICVP